MSRKMKRVAQEEIRQFRGSCYRRKTRSCRWKRVSPSILCVAEHEEGRVSPLISWRRITQPLTAAMRRFEGKLWSLLIVHLGRRIVISHSLCFFFISKLNFYKKIKFFFSPFGYTGGRIRFKNQRDKQTRMITPTKKPSLQISLVKLDGSNYLAWSSSCKLKARLWEVYIIGVKRAKTNSK